MTAVMESAALWFSGALCADPLFARVAGVRGGVVLSTTGHKDPGLAVASRRARGGQSRVPGAPTVERERLLDGS